NGSVTVNFASDGSGTSGLGITALPSQLVGVSGDIQMTGSVFRLAQPSQHSPAPVNFGNVRVGAAASQALTLSNLAPNDGFSESLNASIGGATAGVTAAGSFSLLGPQGSNNSSLVVGIDTATAGAKAGTATIALQSDGTGTSGLGITDLGTQTVNVSGNVYRLANPLLNTTNVALAARVGDAAPQAAISVSNVAPDAFTEGLNASPGAAPAGFSASGSIANLAAGATDNSSLRVALSTATAGQFGGAMSVQLVSTGAGTTGAADLALATGNVNVEGKVYAPALAEVHTAVVDFGIVHRGDIIAPRAVSVSNAAPAAGLNDRLRGAIATGSAGFSAGGTLGDGLAAGANDSGSLQVGLDTSSAGVFTGSANLSFVSHDDDLADLLLDGQQVQLQGQVNNYADPQFQKTGGAGLFGGSGFNFTLDFGRLLRGSGPVSANLRIINGADGPADLVDGLFDLGNTQFLLSGFDPFFDLGAGDFFDGLLVSFDTTNLGRFDDTILLHASAHNASGYAAAFPDISLRITGFISDANAAPAPQTLLLVALALVAMRLRAARRERSAS
ncbi:MAG: choice-of-anchor D domain-containing protein, partial [Rhodocyclaceae bacterium]|nr:choice-of-anchor D domain-containing protein [Rhodocyclaceae bacterium]